MKARAYTLIEVLLASSIFTVMLLGSLAIYGAANRVNARGQREREVANYGFTLTDTINQLVRYATPRRDVSGNLDITTCTPTGSDYCRTVTNGGLWRFWNGAAPREEFSVGILNADNLYQVYYFSLFRPSGEASVVVKGARYGVRQLELTTYYNSGTNSSGPVEVLPGNIFILVPQTGTDDDAEAQAVTKETQSDVATTSDLGGGLSLSREAVGDYLTRRLSFNWYFVDADKLRRARVAGQTELDQLSLYQYQGGETTRSYVNQFTQ